ncbi:CMRF35-like molecule 1 [Labeo rohita]|uniref:CMRF35-like molecule 1 n=1 Tax=Labeo rohita TaxID=84645 RepID=UPI0021E212D8|nr:CMRF35-like molecule 1 [Labeo rohita]
MKIIWIFTLLMIPGVVSSSSWTGYSRGEASYSCSYVSWYTANEKYFCRGQWSECTDKIRTNIKNKWVHSGRFSLHDDTRAAVFTVKIRDLSEQDSDIYYFGIDMYAIADSYCEVNLNVITDVSSISLTSSPAQIKAPGQSVRLSCQISGYALTDYGTAWFRQTPGKTKEWIGVIWGRGSIDFGNSFRSRFTIWRDTGRNELYLDISSLQTEDTAVYFCARTHHSDSVQCEKLTKTDLQFINTVRNTQYMTCFMFRIIFRHITTY